MTPSDQELTQTQAQHVLNLYDFIITFGISLGQVSSMTGISRTTLTNCFLNLAAQAEAKEPRSRNRFKQSDYPKLLSYLEKLERSVARLHREFREAQ